LNKDEQGEKVFSLACLAYAGRAAYSVAGTRVSLPANVATGSAQFSAVGQSSHASFSAQFQVS